MHTSLLHIMVSTSYQTQLSIVTMIYWSAKRTLFSFFLFSSREVFSNNEDSGPFSRWLEYVAEGRELQETVKQVSCEMCESCRRLNKLPEVRSWRKESCRFTRRMEIFPAFEVHHERDEARVAIKQMLGRLENLADGCLVSKVR